MRKFLFSALLLLLCPFGYLLSQPATFSIPVSIGRNNCGDAGEDSLYFYNYTSPNLTNATSPKGCQPVLTPPPFDIFNASIAFNPADQKIYYVWIDFLANPVTSYVWRWSPSPGSCPVAAGGLDTIRTFATNVSGMTFDQNGIAWQLEFSPSAPYQAYLRRVDFILGIVGNDDTLDITGGAKLYDVSSGDITLSPNGQMYFVFNNKLFTPDYGSYGGGTGHIKCTYIDTIQVPAGVSGLTGLSYANGDLIASYYPGCVYRKLDPVTGFAAMVNYSYAAGRGVMATDKTQINSGVGSSKKLISLTATGTPKQYNVVYDIYTRNYGNTPLTNVQVTDNLASINGAANLSNVTVSLLSNPAGVTLNPSYNGNTNINLLAAGQNLPCYPFANNNFTIRISCTISNIVTGVIYNNSAIATAKGFNNVSLRDSSTNGSVPDLNQNDKPDDVGEGQPTPFVVTINATVPPCTVLSQVLYTQNFGSGTGLVSTFPASPSASTTYIGSTVQPLTVNRYSLTNDARNGNTTNWISLTDHTGGVNGRMMVINADAAAYVMYRDTIPIGCAGQQYSASLWAAFLGNSNYQTVCNGLGGFKWPKLLFRIRDLSTGLVVVQFYTPDITSNSWQQLGMKWIMPAGYNNVIFEISNAGPGGCGNDVAIDDIQFGVCDPGSVVSVASGPAVCIGGSASFTSALSDTTVIPGAKVYQWQVSTNNITWTDIAGATSSTYTIPSVAAGNVNKYYRVIMAAAGNMANTTCRSYSPGILLTAKALSVAATSVTRNKNNICPLIPVSLGVTGGTLGTNASWKWYTGSCGGPLAGTGSSIIVTPSLTTTYYVRAEGDCNTTACKTITINISCNIDKDKDGIPDFVESNMPVALQDADGNGIINAFDTNYPGFVDNNNDYINDNFQADGDSDGDGIPNYLDTDFPGRIDSNGDGVDDRFDADLDGIINMLDLDSDNDGIPDVVEQGGVDTDGDGKIDNYSDTDGDGLSQNVDANNVGVKGSGAGLGLLDFDGDGVPNFLDSDSDGDGIPDVVEVGGADANNDGKIDGFVDANGDGISDNIIGVNALLKTGADIIGNGRAGSYPNKNMDGDLRPNPYDVDSDGDGIVDVIEAGLPDANLDGFADGPIGTNGWSKTVSSLAALNLRNSDTDPPGKYYPDYLDIDSDNDGITDGIEGLPTTGYLLPLGTDTDGDGLDNAYDNTGTWGGRGIAVVDSDGDGIPDYRDLDTDSDGAIDRIEGNDWNFNNVRDEDVTLLNIDTDGDGLDDKFDLDNTSAKTTSSNMGNGGTTSGPASPGTRAVVQKTLPSAGNRDWRWIPFVLPVQFVEFSGVQKSDDKVLLNWSVIIPADIDRFEIFRSTDNINYNLTGTLKSSVTPNKLQSFSLLNNISNLNTDVIFYRLYVIGKNGEKTFSSVILVKIARYKTDVVLMPNPASDNTIIKMNIGKESNAAISLINNTGSTVWTKNQKVYKGSNSILIDNLNRFSSGIYTIRIVVNDEVINTKLALISK